MSHVDPPALSLLQQALPSLPTGVSIQEVCLLFFYLFIHSLLMILLLMVLVLYCVQQLDEWKEANLTFSKGEAGLRGVYKQGSNGFRALIRHPVTKNQVTLLSSTAPNARELCARAYDRTVLRWFGRVGFCFVFPTISLLFVFQLAMNINHAFLCSAAVTNYNWSEYVNDDGPDVRKAAEATGRHEHIKGKYST